MPEPVSFDYAVVRVVPRVERQEFINAGVILYCPARDYLQARIELDSRRLAILAPGADLQDIAHSLEIIPLICLGGTGAGPIGQLSPAKRFDWLASPRSTVIQISPVHAGICTDPATMLEELVRKMVRVETSRPDGDTAAQAR